MIADDEWIIDGDEDIRTGPVPGSPDEARRIVEAAAAACGLRVDGAP